jgi:type I restriction enzyme S subunit
VSFPTYRNYKPSGELWLGQVPAHWTLRRLGFYFIERRQKVSDKVFKPLSVSKAGIVPQIETAAKTDDGDNRKRVNRGDFVINSRSDRKGSAGVSELEGSVSLINTVLIPQEPVCMRFIHHLFRSVPFQEEYYRHGKGIVADLWSTNFSEMKNICLSMPPSSEQEQIASFLDQETSKIDALISEQQRLIELLKEKRQAVISHAVTKGLNPDVRMKPSGVEWLGEVPEHWEKSKIKHLCFVNDGNHGEEYPNESDYTSQEEGVPFIRGGNLNDLTITHEGMLYITREKNASMRKGGLKESDILFVNRGDIGKLALVPKEFEGANLNSQIAYLRPGMQITPQFLLYFLSSRSIGSLLESVKEGSVLTQFPIRDLVNITIPLPPNPEQMAIAAFVTEEVEKSIAIATAAEAAIALLTERRTALISAAVTGKIDVRNYAATQKDAA